MARLTNENLDALYQLNTTHCDVLRGLLEERFHEASTCGLRFICYVKNVEADVCNGINTYTGERFEPTPIKISDIQIVDFAKSIGHEFGEEVEYLLERLNE